MNKLDVNAVIFDYENAVRAIDNCCRHMYSQQKSVRNSFYITPSFQRVNNKASYWDSEHGFGVFGVRNEDHFVRFDFRVENQLIEDVSKDFKQLTKAIYEQFVKYYDIKLGKTEIKQIFDYGVNYAVKVVFECKTGGKIVVIIDTNSTHEDPKEDKNLSIVVINVYFCHSEQFAKNNYDEIVKFHRQYWMNTSGSGEIKDDIEKYIDELKQCVEH